MEITPLGDSALIVRVGQDSEDALGAVLAAQRRLEGAQIPGVIDVTPAYTTVGLFYHPGRVVDSGAEPDAVFDWLATRIRQALSNSDEVSFGDVEARSIDVPVCFDSQFSLDLEEVARRAAIQSNEVIDLYCRADYRVNCIGFTPGFPFLSGLPKQLATPRRAAPRKKVPAGSVAIGGGQTGIYPIESPGGWNIIGRTPLHLLDPEKNPPAVFRAGDRVRFRSILREEFEGLKR